MRRSLWSLAAAAALCACSHGGAAKPSAQRGSAIKIALKPIAVGPELEGSAVPGVFEQCLCSALFELNEHQVVCPDDARAFLKAQRDASLLGGPGASLQDADRMLAAPRSLALTAVKSEAKVIVGGLLVDADGKPLGRFEKAVAADGADLTDRARELAAEVVAVP